MLRLDGKGSPNFYEVALDKLHVLFVRPQRFTQIKKKIMGLFEGRDAAGKGGTIKRFLALLNLRICHAVALARPIEKDLAHICPLM